MFYLNIIFHYFTREIQSFQKQKSTGGAEAPLIPAVGGRCERWGGALRIEAWLVYTSSSRQVRATQ